MPATAESFKPKADTMELYRLRDELVEIHKPANAHERMLVTQIAQAWLRLQRAVDLEQRYFEKNDMVEVVSTKLNEFKAVTRFTSDCDRAFRQTVALLKSAQRQRRKEDLSSPNARRAPQHSADANAPAISVLPVTHVLDTHPQQRE